MWEQMKTLTMSTKYFGYKDKNLYQWVVKSTGGQNSSKSQHASATNFYQNGENGKPY